MLQIGLRLILKSYYQKPKKIRNIDKVFGKKLDLRGIKFPTHKKEYAKIEKQNNISINVFGYGNEKPYHIYT